MHILESPVPLTAAGTGRLASVFESQITLGNLLTIAVVTIALAVLFNRLSIGLRHLVSNANVSLGEVNASIARVELMETRLNALEHRLAVIERYQIRVLDAEATVRGAGIQVPTIQPKPPPRG